MSGLTRGGFAHGGSVFGATTTSMGLPWPKGDPGELEGVASKLRSVTDELAATATDLSGAAQHEGVWNAAASRSFATAVRGQRTQMSKSQEQLDDGARGVQLLARRLEEAQDRVRRLDDRVRRAKEAADAARLAADAAYTRSLDARRTEDSGGPGAAGTADDVARESIAKERAATEAEGDFAEVLRKAKAEAERECHEVLSRDKATARVLEGVAVSAPLGGASFQVPPLPTSRLANHVAPHYAPILRHDSEEDSFPTGVPFEYGPGPAGKGIQFDFWPRYRDNDHWAPGGAFDHDGDFERISVQLDGDGNLDVVSTEAHGAQQGKRRAGDMDTQGDQPVLYPGRGSHATYPDSGTNFADNGHFPSPDLTDGKGREVDTRPMVRDMRTDPELNTGHKVDTRESPVDQARDRPLPEDLDSLERSDGAAPELPEPPPIIPTPWGPVPNPLFGK